MQIVRFIVTVAFTWMLVRATFANTVEWRHPHAAVSATTRHEPARQALVTERKRSERGT